MTDYTNSVTSVGAVTSVPIILNDSTWMWEISQITVTYSKTTDVPNVAILKNGVPFAGNAPMFPGPGVVPGQAALSQTFAGDPHLWRQARDDVEAVVTNGSAGALITVFAMYNRYSADDPSVQTWKNT